MKLLTVACLLMRSVKESGLCVREFDKIIDGELLRMHRADSRRYISHHTTVTSALDDFSSTKVQTSTTRRGYVQQLASVAAAVAAAAADDDDDGTRCTCMLHDHSHWKKYKSAKIGQLSLDQSCEYL